MLNLQSTSRRLPIYLLVDTSHSMNGPPIEAVNNGLQELAAVLRNDNHAVESAYISVITFHDTAQQIVPLTETMAFRAPALTATGRTALGAALTTLGRALDADLHEKNPDHPGDWKPLIFLLTDGEPTDDWRGPAQQLRQRTRFQAARSIAIGCGPNVNMAVLAEVVNDARSVVRMPEMTPEYLRNCMKWISQSVRVASKSASRGADTPTVRFDGPAAPAGLQFVAR